jgi:EAL domain-containing protein (putative c-di-GMP-specific phosphodiesterase class I)
VKRKTTAVIYDALTFQRPDLMDEVLAALQVADLSPESLELELTESVAMREPELGAARSGYDERG